MKFYFVVMKKIALFALGWVYDYIDADKDGKLEKDEIKNFTNEIKTILKGGLRK